MIKNRRAFIVGIKSSTLSNKEITFLKKYRPWGVILFSRNISSIEQTKKLTDRIKKIFKDKKYPILIDQEGGRVNRLSKIISFDNLTSEYFGNLFTKDKKKFNIIYKLFIDKTSYLLKSIGVNINTVPVLDRDEARYAQATKQMIETGNYSSIKFQEQLRSKKPTGIYWLQSVSVNIFSADNRDKSLNKIWKYRFVSSLFSLHALIMFCAFLISSSL